MRCLRISIRLLAAFAVICTTASAERAFDVKWMNERLTVRAVDAPLRDMIDEVARLTGIEVAGREKLGGSVSVEFSDLTPKDALAKLLVNVNYVVQERPATAGGTAPQLVVSVHSMAGYSLPDRVFSGPLEVPALNALVAEEAADVADTRDAELEDDPDSYYDDIREQKVEAARLATQGAFGPKADAASLVKLLANYNDEIRLEALKALASRPMQVALAPLIGALGDEVWEIRTAAVEVFGRAKDRESLRAVGQVLEKSDDKDARIDALRVLAQRGDPQSAPYLRAVLKDTDAFIREAAERMLAELDRRERLKEANPR